MCSLSRTSQLKIKEVGTVAPQRSCRLEGERKERPRAAARLAKASPMGIGVRPRAPAAARGPRDVGRLWGRTCTPVHTHTHAHGPSDPDSSLRGWIIPLSLLRKRTWRGSASGRTPALSGTVDVGRFLPVAAAFFRAARLPRAFRSVIAGGARAGRLHSCDA